MIVDFHARERHFLDHLAPVYLALPRDARGAFVVNASPAFADARTDLAAHARSLGIEPTRTLPLRDRPVVVASIGDVRRMQKVGRRRIALMEHGSGQSFGGDPRAARSPSYPGGKNRDAVSLFLSPNTHAAGRDRGVYPKAAVAVVGCPKLDAPIERVPHEGRPIVAVSFHWDCTVCPETRGGWREFQRAVQHLTYHYEVIGHGHPRAMDQLALEYRKLRIEVVREFRDVVARADVYVNEGSSTLFEAAAFGLPVVVLNPSFFRKSIQHGLRFWNAAHVGPNVRSRGGWDSTVNRRLRDAIDLALSDPPEVRAAREDALGIVYAHRGDAAQRAAAAVLEWATAGKAVAA